MKQKTKITAPTKKFKKSAVKKVVITLKSAAGKKLASKKIYLKINGKFNGTINSNGNLDIDKSAVCTVDKMSASSIVISGSVTGNISATERVEMCNGSKVKGNVETARLRIADNVDFEGQVTMLESEPDVDLFSVASDEYKQTLLLKSDSDAE